MLQNDRWFAYVCGLDEGDDWRDENVWIKANPNLGVSVTKDYRVREAEAMPAVENIVRRLNFCEWTDRTSARSRWRFGTRAPRRSIWKRFAIGRASAGWTWRASTIFRAGAGVSTADRG